MPFVWDDDLRLYVDIGEDEEDDEIIPLIVMVLLRDQFSAVQQEEARAIARRLVDAEIDLQTFVIEMRGLIRDTYTTQYLFGRGGADEMTQEDFARLEQLILVQYGFLQNFAIKIAQGLKTPNEIIANAALYMAASVQAFERARSEGVFDLVLPAYPGDGSSICLANDKCFWRVIEEETRWLAFWVRRAVESCPTCLQREAEWAPLIVEKF